MTGTGTAFEADQTCSLNAITAGASNSIAIVEDTINPVNWMKPEDLSIPEALDLFDVRKNPESMLHVKETKFERKIWYASHCAFFDGSVQYLGPNKSRKTMQHLFLKDSMHRGYEELDEFVHEPRDRQTILLPYGYLLVALNIFLAILPYFWGAKGKSRL